MSEDTITIPKDVYEQIMQTAINPPMMIVDSVETVIKRRTDLSSGQINRFRGFTVEGYEKLLQENEELKNQISEIKEILGVNDDDYSY